MRSLFQVYLNERPTRGVKSLLHFKAEGTPGIGNRIPAVFFKVLANTFFVSYCSCCCNNDKFQSYTCTILEALIKCMSQAYGRELVSIDMPVEDGDTHNEQFPLQFPTQVWTSFEISQTLDPGSTDAYTNRINIGETVRFSRANPNPVEFSNVKVMVSAGNREPADYALIRHLNIQGVEFDGE